MKQINTTNKLAKELTQRVFDVVFDDVSFSVGFPVTRTHGSEFVAFTPLGVLLYNGIDLIRCQDNVPFKQVT